MSRVDFLKECQPYNKEYYELFGEVPISREYMATEKEYIEALKKSIENKVKIDTYLKKLKQTTEKGAKL